MKKINLLFIILIIIFNISCGADKPTTKYSIFIPERCDTGECWFEVDSYKIDNGSIEFMYGSDIVRATNYQIHKNY